MSSHPAFPSVAVKNQPVSLVTHPLASHLASRQRLVLESIVAYLQEQGYPPSIQQLCQRCGLKSTSTVHYHLTALKQQGLIHWNPAEKRALTVNPALLEGLDTMPRSNFYSSSSPSAPSNSVVKLPLLGTIAAGSPLQTIPDSVEHFDLSSDLCPTGCYALRVKGLSMIEDHIMDGDIVIINPNAPVRDGDVVVALVEGESATLKRIYREQNGVRLQPANSSMDAIFSQNVDVQGKVESILRRFSHH